MASRERNASRPESYENRVIGEAENAHQYQQFQDAVSKLAAAGVQNVSTPRDMLLWATRRPSDALYFDTQGVPASDAEALTALQPWLDALAAGHVTLPQARGTP